MEYEYIKKCLQLIVGLFAMALIINCSSDGDSQGGSTPIIIVTSNITSFESVNAGSVSASQNIQVSANDLTGSLIVKTSNNFEISIDNASFSNQVTINKNDANSGFSEIYVRFSPTVSAVGVLTGSLTFESVKATPKS